ncbi:unnamed protein product, partial [Owenia fusiformis]
SCRISRFTPNLSTTYFDMIRDYFFEKAKSKVTEHCNSLFGPLAERDENEVPVNLQPKKRQGKNKLTNSVTDIYDLYLYLTDNVDVFPKGVLSTNSFLPEVTMSREASNNMHRNERAASMDVTITVLTQRVKELEVERDSMRKDICTLSSKLDQITGTCKTLQSELGKLTQNTNSIQGNLASITRFVTSSKPSDLVNSSAPPKQTQQVMANFAKSSITELNASKPLSTPNDPDVPDYTDGSNNVNNNTRPESTQVSAIPAGDVNRSRTDLHMDTPGTSQNAILPHTLLPSQCSADQHGCNKLNGEPSKQRRSSTPRSSPQKVTYTRTQTPTPPRPPRSNLNLNTPQGSSGQVTYGVTDTGVWRGPPPTDRGIWKGPDPPGKEWQTWLGNNQLRRKKAAAKQKEYVNTVPTRPDTTRDNASTRPRSSGLRGIEYEEVRVLYLENIYQSSEEDDEDTINNVKRFAVDNNIRLKQIHVVHNRISCDKVGCKITIPKHQVDRALCVDLWPVPIRCREWERRRRRYVDNDDRSDVDLRPRYNF